MDEMCFFELRQRPRWKEACAAWCAEKWSVPLIHFATRKNTLILAQPVLAGPDSMWFAMPATELAAAGAVWGMVRFTRRLPLS